MKAIRYKGTQIAQVNLPRFEVRRADGRKVKTFTTMAAAKAFVDGYSTAVNALAPKEAKA